MADYHQDTSISTILPPLIICLSIWLLCYYQSVLSPTGKPKGFESIWISNLNSIVLCIMAALSLLQIIPEKIPSCWSSSFFIVDVVDCIRRKDVMWGFHGVISLVLNVCTASSSVHRGLRSASKGFFTEVRFFSDYIERFSSKARLNYLCCVPSLFRQLPLMGRLLRYVMRNDNVPDPVTILIFLFLFKTDLLSTIQYEFIRQPFLNHWKTHKCYTTYLIFFTSFTLCRIVWVPLFVHNTYMIHLDGKIDYLIWPSVLFYLLQLSWWAKMVAMLFHYKSPDQIEKERNAKKKD